MKIGDKVVCRPVKIVDIDPLGRKTENKLQTGVVEYVHPKGHYVTVAFETPKGVLRESFMPQEVQATGGKKR